MTEEQKEQVDGLIDESVLGGLSEDFLYESEEQAQQVLDHLKKKINNLEVSAIYYEEEEE